MRRFDENEISSRLEGLSRAHRVMFACSTAQRWLDEFASVYRGELEAIHVAQLQEGLNIAWASVDSDRGQQSLRPACENAMSIAPDDEDDEFYGESDTALQNTALVVAKAIQSAPTGDPTNATGTAMLGYENADWLAELRLDVDFNDQGSGDLLLESEEVQHELECQHRDLESLEFAQSLKADIRDTRQRMKRAS